MEEKRRTGVDPAWGQLPEEGDVDHLHASPPCQDLSRLNQHTDASKVQRDLYPLLDQVGARRGAQSCMRRHSSWYISSYQCSLLLTVLPASWSHPSGPSTARLALNAWRQACFTWLLRFQNLEQNKIR